MSAWAPRRLQSYLRGALRGLSFSEDIRRLRSLLDWGREGKLLQSYARDQLSALESDPLSGYLRRSGELDIAEGAFLIACESTPGLSLSRALGSFAALSDRLADKLRGCHGPRQRIAVVNRFVFESLQLRPIAGRRGEDQLDHLLLHRVLERRIGHCLGLSTLYLCLCQRNGLAVHGVSAPGHFFCRYDDGELRFNIEPTLSGQARPDDHYVEKYGIVPEARAQGVYLRNLESREVLGEILNNRANDFWRRGRQAEALRDLQRATDTNANFARGYSGRGFMKLCQGQLESAAAELESALALDPGAARSALLLGEARLGLGHLAEAVQALEQCLVLAPDWAVAHSLLGRSLAQQGRGDQARRSHLRAVELDPQSSMARINLAAFLATIAEPAQAKIELLVVLEQGHDAPAAIENLIGLQLPEEELRGELEKLSARYFAIERQRPDDAASLYALALLQNALGASKADVRGFAERAHALSGDARSCCFLARLALSEGQLVRALRFAKLGLEQAADPHQRRRLASIRDRSERALGIARRG